MRPGSRERAGLLAAVAAALVVGVCAVVLPILWSAALTAATALLGLLLLARRYVAAGAATTEPGGGETPSAPQDLRLARYLYFAGLLTIGQTTFRPLLDLTLSDWLFFAALMGVLAGSVVDGRRLTFRIPPLLVVGVVLFVVSGTVSSLDAVAPLQSVARVTRFGYLTIVWFWLGTLVLRRESHLRAAIGCWVASVALDGVAAVLQARGVALPYLGPVMWGRMTAFTEHVNDLGGAAAVAMAPAFALIFTAARLRGRLAWTASLLAIVAAAVLSGSVGGMAAGVGALGVWFVVSSSGWRPLVVALVALTVALALAQLQGDLGLPDPLQRVLAATGQTGGGRYSTIATRVKGYDYAWTRLADGGWLGVGLDEQSGDAGGAEVHNVILKAWYEAGWAGAVGMVCVLLGALGSALHSARLAATRNMRLAAAGLFSAVVALVVFGLAAPILHQRYAWVAVALSVSCLAITRERSPAAGRRRAETGYVRAEPLPPLELVSDGRG